ncbi:hypothetical protein GCM10009799_37390 [Nocardiopsis rhodophaea]|uniref:Penicillin-insensitive transglycosylase n=2 Tax=Nocardiopsis rhodophaea TaxID=280238 RepID=A0ABP5ES97_9ACTN
MPGGHQLSESTYGGGENEPRPEADTPENDEAAAMDGIEPQDSTPNTHTDNADNAEDSDDIVDVGTDQPGASDPDEVGAASPEADAEVNDEGRANGVTETTTSDSAGEPGVEDTSESFGWFDPSSDSDQNAGDDDAEEDDPSSPSAFKDSGSFFRDRVARTLAEQGYSLDADGRIGVSDEPAASIPEAGDGAGNGADANADAERAAGGGADSNDDVDEPDDTDDDTIVTVVTAVDPTSVGDGADDSSASSPLDDDGITDADEKAENDSVWDPEGTAAFTPVWDDDDDDDPDAAAAMASTPKAGSEGSPASSDVDGAEDPAASADEDASVASGGSDGSDPEKTETDVTAPAAAAGLGAAAASAAGAAAASSGTPADAGTPTPTPDATNDAQASKTTATFDIPGASGSGADPADGDSPAAAAAGGIATATKAKKAKKAKKNSAMKGGGKPKKPLWLRLTLGTFIGVGLCVLLGVIGFGVAYATIPVPDGTKAAATEQGSTFYYADGETEFAYRGTDREPLTYDEIPEVVQDAAISAEDRGFWTEPGVSVTGTLRAVWSTVTGQQVQGGSTITQQMVRGYYDGVSKDKTITRKVKEIVISLKVDQSKDKKWVMEQYLNTIYFGRQAYGIQAAAQAYFHKDVGELNASEAAFLAAAIQQPSLFGQADEDYTPSMESRWQYVINGMVELNSEDPETGITQAEADKAEFPTPDEQTPQSDLSGYKGYMFQQAMRELEKLGYNEDLINRGGYKIVTTFDEDLMKEAKEAVESTSGMDSLPDHIRAGMASVEPSTGEVKAFYGGKDFIQNQYDSAFSGSAQAGSAFKPYTLAAALQEGYSVDSVVDGSSPMDLPGNQRIENAGGRSYGPLTLAQATAKSSNTAYARLNKQVGGDKTAAAAEAAGIPASRMTDKQKAAASFPLGISSLRPIDQANGFATFANGGEYIEAHVVREIQNKDGENERPEVKRNQAFPEHVANDVTYALETVVNGGTGSNAALGRPAAGKTGTTDKNVATWFVGYTPQLATAMTVYSTDNKSVVVPGWGVVQGGSLSASIWQKFMTRAMENEDIESFPGRSGDGTIENWAPNPEPQGDSPPQNQGQQQPDPQPQLPPDNGGTGNGTGNGGGNGNGDGGGDTPPPSGGDGTGGGQEPDPGGGSGGDDLGGGDGNEGGDIPQPGGGGTVGPG